MNPLLGKRWWLNVLVIFASILLILFIDETQLIDYQVITLFVMGLSLPIIWVYLMFPVSNFHYWHLYRIQTFFSYFFYKTRFFVLIWISWVVFLVIKSQLLPAFFIAPFLFLILNFVIFWGVGNQSQLWRTGKSGNKVRAFAKETGQLISPMGSIPTLIRTIIILIVTIFTIILTLNSSFEKTVIILATLLILLIFIVLFLMKSDFKNKFIATFISDNAFYDEYFLIQDSVQSMKPVPAESLFWIPKRQKTTARFLLTQHLRIRSTARIYFGISIIIWVLNLASPVWFNSTSALIFMFVSLMAEFHLFFDETMGSFGLHQHQTISKRFSIHFLVMIRWLPISVITLFVIETWGIKIMYLILFQFLFTVANSLMQAIYHSFKSQKQYG